MNVAADPLFTASYTGVRGGLVIVNADDPQMHSSQNEQDNRNYAYAAKLPLLEPSDPAEAKADASNPGTPQAPPSAQGAPPGGFEIAVAMIPPMG